MRIVYGTLEDEEDEEGPAPASAEEVPAFLLRIFPPPFDEFGAFTAPLVLGGSGISGPRSGLSKSPFAWRSAKVFAQDFI